MIDLIGRMWDRVNSMLRFGYVTHADESKNVQQLQVKFNDIELRNDVQSVAMYGFASSPLPGSAVVVFQPSGFANNGLVLATHDPRHRPTGMAPGEVKIYDQHGQSIHLANDGTIHITGQHTFNIIADTTVNVTAPTVNVTASSALNVTCPIMTLTGEVRVVGELKKNGTIVIAP